MRFWETGTDVFLRMGVCLLVGEAMLTFLHRLMGVDARQAEEELERQYRRLDEQAREIDNLIARLQRAQSTANKRVDAVCTQRSVARTISGQMKVVKHGISHVAGSLYSHPKF